MSRNKNQQVSLLQTGSVSGGAVLRLKLVDWRYQDHTPIALVDLAVPSFLWFSPKLA